MHFNQSQYRGILWLLLLIIAGQLFFYFFPFGSNYTPTENHLLQREIDSLKKLASQPKKDTIYPFNPNFITDYKAYRLGLTPEQFDRLQAFRAQDKYVNSAVEFQQVTGISDTLLVKISSSFKFPEWVKHRKEFANKLAPKHLPKQDINTATAEELMKIYGIGEGFSKRILQYREKLGGFTYIEQVSEVYKLEKEVYERIAERFEVQTVPVIEKQDINKLNMYQLSKVPYVHYGEGKKIVGLRSALGQITSFSQLLQIEGFDEQRLQRLQLYLMITQ